MKFFISIFLFIIITMSNLTSDDYLIKIQELNTEINRLNFIISNLKIENNEIKMNFNRIYNIKNVEKDKNIMLVIIYFSKIDN